MADYAKPLPRQEVPELTQPFWDAATRHELLIPRCRPCNRYFWYPRPACPHCLREDWEWAKVSGRGRLHTYTVVRQPQNPNFQGDVPYAYAVVQLDEGVRMISNIVDCPIPDGLQVDMPLVATFDDVTPEWTLVKFKPA
ncbi:MAG: Zn-ribbon domain-containing OB-fold protein [Chloroflexi bacterium]|nr:Zn-ribbon domain-containing OB-fold protein [Chloroflexota bacterium]